MKIAVLLVFCLGLALGASVPAPPAVDAAPTLHNDLQELLNLLPTQQILQVVTYYANNDKEVQEIIDWLLGKEFNSLVALINRIPYYINFVYYLNVHGVDVPEYAKAINAYLHNLRASRPVLGLSRPRRAIRTSGMIEEIKALIPTEKIKALWCYKVAFNREFQEFTNKFTTEDFKTIVEAVQAASEYKQAVEFLEEKGVNVDELIEYGGDLIGIDTKSNGSIMPRSEGLLVVLLVYLYILSV